MTQPAPRVIDTFSNQTTPLFPTIPPSGAVRGAEAWIMYVQADTHLQVHVHLYPHPLIYVHADVYYTTTCTHLMLYMPIVL